MVYDELLTKYPHLKDDIQSILEWFSLSYNNRNLLIFEEKIEDINKFKKQITEMSRTLKKFPTDKQRVEKIYKTLKHNGEVYPIFVDETDGFILEGRHRIVAQYLNKTKNVNVIYVSTQEKLDEIKFTKIDDVLFNKIECGYDYKFRIENLDYVVNFDQIDKTINKENSWSISFKFIPKLEKNSEEDIIKYLTTNPYSNTGLKVEYKVYSHVISSILKFVELFHPFLIYFDARDKKRYRIYEKLATNLIKNLKDYKLHSGSSINGIYSFIVIKK